jgi:hypothetical protein
MISNTPLYTLKPSNGFGLEMGLLQPNSGFENTYTYNIIKIISWVQLLRSSPITHMAQGPVMISPLLDIWVDILRTDLMMRNIIHRIIHGRLARQRQLNDTDFNIYNYYIKGQENLVGASVERTIGNTDLAFNVDYWKWSDDVESLYENDSSIGAAFYICPNFDKFSIPIRLEYINQDKSQLYTESPDTQDIYSATLSPTWHFNDSAYIRAEASYINADSAFEMIPETQGSQNQSTAVETGYLF